MRRLLTLLVVFALTIAAAQNLTPTQERRAQRIGDNLRCPVCSAVPITHSPSELSQNMMREVRAQIAAGRSDTDIYAYFSSRFGETVLLDPPMRGVNLALWAIPGVALLGGSFLLARYLRGASSAPRGEGVDEALVARVERDLRKDTP
ncbi:cytochrome c-type biogenesis protein [Deinococcus yavapaiensis]|uniref:Cytochrome c-type biogenesis protein n=1 Tax=Deinococcus yavapaiensis KR-236 TaxID=694435 RepID=A0A318S9H8_9DEIO|nr:cytochrome c-type biogenesis protein [Deinococcus yavapaiensis]PYE55871.1 cytochrome c-type biogenesis protein CcmH [Deinococcus yavapaiensis KR-236]